MKAIPAISDLYNNLAYDLKNKLGLTDVQLKMVADAMSSVLAAQFKLAYLYLVDVQNNIFPDTADLAANGGTLERMGAIYLNRLPFPATEGVYTASISGSAGATLPAGLTFKSDDNAESPGNLYMLDNPYTLSGSGDVITLRALNAGTAYELAVSDTLTATQPLIGVSQVATIAGVTTAAQDEESTDLYRQNIIDVWRLEPQGGAKTDYRLWAADADGVQRVYPYVANGDAGTVQVYVEATPGASTDGKGTPSGGLLTAVEAVIRFDPDTTLPTNERGRIPLQAGEFLEVLAVTPIPVDVTITGITTTDAGIRATISANLAAYLRSVRPYIDGCDLPEDENDYLTSVKVQGVVSDTLGNTNSFSAFVLSVDGAATSSYQFTGANIPYLRNVTYS